MAGKRSYGTGSVRKVGDRYIARGMVGTKQVRCSGSTKDEALGALRERQTEASRQGTAATAANQTVAQYLDTWLAQVERNQRFKTFESYSVCVKRLVPHIGAIKLRDLRADDIERAYNVLSDSGLSGRSVQQCHAVLNTALKRAVKRRTLPWNPMDGVDRPSYDKTERPHLSVEDTARLIQETHQDRFHVLYVVLVTTGLRLGEALGLRWQDLNMDTGTLTVKQVAQRQAKRGIVLDKPKSEKSKRTIALPALTLAALRDHHTALQFEAKQARELGIWTDGDLVFPNWYGTPLEQITVERGWKKTLARLGLPATLRLHDLRHTAVSHRVALGDSPKVVQTFAGHADVGTTLGVYAHSDFEAQRQSADRLNQALSAAIQASN